MAPPLLRLALEPIVPLRAPVEHQWLGYQLRLPRGGALVAQDDPLLPAFGAIATTPFVRDELEEATQEDVFAPGRELRLELEPFDPDDPDLVTLWSADGSIQLGELHDDEARQVRAGVEHGLEYRVVVLAEHRIVVDDRRGGLALFVFPAALVELASVPPMLRPARRRPVRRRIVLVAGEEGDLRWWDAAASGGPLTLAELPFTPDFREEFERVADELVEQAEQVASGLDGRGFDRMDRWMEDEALKDEVVSLWRRARAELGSAFLAGCRLAGRTNVVWEPSAIDDIPF